MFTIDTKSPEFKQMVEAISSQIADRAFEKLEDKVKKREEWPPMLSKKELANFLGVSSSKVSQLVNRHDFPVTREFGRPLVPTHLLIKWIDSHTEMSDPDFADKWSTRFTG